MSFLEMNRKPDEEVVIILDIGSGSVGGGIVMLSKQSKPKVLYTVRFPIVIGEKPDSGKLLNAMTVLLEGVLKNLAKEGLVHLNFLSLRHKKIREVFCFFTSPWQVSQTKVLKVNKQTPFLVSKKYLQDLIKGELSASKLATGADDAVKGINLIVEQKIIQTKLNGYQTLNPNNKKARTVEVVIFQGSIARAVTESIEALINKIIGHKRISFHTFPLVATNSITDIFSHDTNFVCIDVTGEITDISLVKDGVAEEILSIPLGRNSLVRKVSTDLSVNSDIALSYLRLSSENRADASLVGELKNSSDSFGKEWVTYLSEVLGNFDKSSSLPPKIYLTCLEDVQGIFVRYIEQNEKNKSRNNTLVVVDSEILGHFVTYAAKVSPDVYVAIESIFSNKLLDS